MSSLQEWREKVRMLRKEREHVRFELEEGWLALQRNPQPPPRDDWDAAAAESRARMRNLAAEEADACRRLDVKGSQQFLSQVRADVPVLLLPLRVQTRYVLRADASRDLCIRVFPDDLFLQSHEPRLTPEEAAAGEALWAAPEAEVRDAAGRVTEPGRPARWRGLTATFGRSRASWVVRASAPDTRRFGSPLETPVGVPCVRCLPEQLVFRIDTGGGVWQEYLGEPIPYPLPMGFDPLLPDMGFEREDGPENEDPHAPDRPAANLKLPAELTWQEDFDDAVRVGLGYRLVGFQGRVRTLMVLGVRLAEDEQQSAERLAQLFCDHAHTDGLSFIRQGTPTNVGGDATPALEDDVQDLARLMGDGIFSDSGIKTPFDQAADGLRLAWALGLDPAALQRVEGAERRDGAQSIAMQRALWAGTFGYYGMQLLSPLFEDAADDLHAGERLLLTARFFYTQFVQGRGPLPALRIGRQPYGVLPVSADMITPVEGTVPAWRDEAFDEFTHSLQLKLAPLVRGWLSLTSESPTAGAGLSSAQLVEILGLQASSVQWRSERLIGRHYLKAYSDWSAQAGSPQAFAAYEKLLEERWTDFKNSFFSDLFTQRPRIFDLSFFGASWRSVQAGATLERRAAPLLDGPLVDDLPLSEHRGIDPAYPNYISALHKAKLSEVATMSLGTDEHGNEKAPLLYLALRHSLMHETTWAAMRLLHFLGAEWASFKEREVHNVPFQLEPTPWDLDATIDWPGATFSFNPVELAEDPEKRQLWEGIDARTWFGDLDETRDALDQLSLLPTAALERLFAEHMDAAHYRIDAWVTGLVFSRLMGQRLQPDDVHSRPLLTHNPGEDIKRLRPSLSHAALPAPSRGLVIGAYAWVEDLKPDEAPEVVSDLPPELTPAEGFVVREPNNAGLIHAPSLNHASTAAVLRSASLSQPDRTALNVNLSSRRVRAALDLFEGVRQGQGAPALLGYRLERLLRAHPLATDLLPWLPALRKAFPMPQTEAAASDGTPAIALGEVVNGLTAARASRNEGDAFLNALASVKKADATDIPKRLLEIARRVDEDFDACADLLVSEGVHQAAQGNFERAAGVLSAAGEFDHVPDTFEVVTPPRSGHAIQHRLLLAFNEDDPDAAAADVRLGPCARMAPALNRWLSTLMGDLGTTMVGVWVRAPGAPEALQILSIAALGADAIELPDWVANGTLDARLRHHVSATLLQAQPGWTGGDLVVEPFPTGLAAGQRPFGAALPLLRTLAALLSSAHAATARDVLDAQSLAGPGALPDDGVDVAELHDRVRGLQAGSLVSDARKAIAGLLSAAADPGSSTADIDTVLLIAARFGMTVAVPPPQRPLEHAAAELEMRRALASRVAEALEKKIAAAESALMPPDASDAMPLSTLEACRATVEAILGRSHTLLPVLNLQSLASRFEAGAVEGVDAARADRWLLAAGAARERTRRLQQLRLLAGLGGNVLPTPLLRQWPAGLGHWVGISAKPDESWPGEVTSALMQSSAELDLGQPLSALVVDSWSELIPAVGETTGIAMHHDSPAAEPPQAMLLAVCTRQRQNDGQWAWNELAAAVEQSFDLARLRTVEPDLLHKTSLDAVLPATAAAESPVPVTVSTSYFANVSDAIAKAQVSGYRKVQP